MTLTRVTLRAAAPVLALAILAAPGFAQSPAAPAAPAASAAPAATAPATAPQILPDIALGQPDAPLTIVEYASFTCSHCRDFHEENLPRLKAEYIDTGKVRFIQRDVYFDQFGLWAGVLARCGGEVKYYAMSDMLFAEQKKWMTAKTPEDFSNNLRKLGKAAGFTDAQMDACWADQKQVEALVATFQKNATADNIEGTPTFIIGDEKVANEPWEALKAKIDEKLAAAEKAAPKAN